MMKKIFLLFSFLFSFGVAHASIKFSLMKEHTPTSKIINGIYGNFLKKNPEIKPYVGLINIDNNSKIPQIFLQLRGKNTCSDLEEKKCETYVFWFNPYENRWIKVFYGVTENIAIGVKPPENKILKKIIGLDDIVVDNKFIWSWAGDKFIGDVKSFGDPIIPNEYPKKNDSLINASLSSLQNLMKDNNPHYLRFYQFHISTLGNVGYIVYDTNGADESMSGMPFSIIESLGDHAYKTLFSRSGGDEFVVSGKNHNNFYNIYVGNSHGYAELRYSQISGEYKIKTTSYFSKENNTQ